MGVLFRYELKKLFSRKLVWLLMALCAAFILFADWDLVKDSASGKVQGMKDIYSLYEGQVVTGGFNEAAKKDMEKYIAAHPDQFEPFTSSEDSSVTDFFPKDSGYYYGAYQAFDQISNARSVDDYQKAVQDAEEILKRGTDESGSPLLYFNRMDYEATVEDGVKIPVIHYAQGWEELESYVTPAPGAMVLFLVGFGLLPLFSAEGSSKMEAVLLCGAKRRRAAVAKMLAASCFACMAATVLFGEEFLMVAATYGLQGAPWHAGPFALAAFSSALAAIAIAALIALASALFRHPLMGLLFAGAGIAVQILLYSFLSENVNLWINSPLWYHVQSYSGMLPAMALVNHYPLISCMTRFKYAAFTLAFPAAVSALLFWLAPLCFLKQRKA